MPISVEQFRPRHAQDVAQLHIQGIKTGFLSKLGNRFLIRLYRDMARTPGSVVFVARNEENSIIGFAAGTVDTGKMYKRILLRCGWLYCIMLLPRAFDPDVLKKIIETMLYSVRFGRRVKLPFTKNTSNIVMPVRAELLSIVVDGKNRGKNIGRQLVSALETFFKDHAVGVYKVVTLSTDNSANAFYGHCGFALSTRFTHHENVMNEYHKSL
jgi:GNAT superfamily N-acetyltransferase